MREELLTRANDPLTVTVAEAKRMTGLGHTTVYELLKTGKLKSTKVGNRRPIYFSAIKELLAIENDVPAPQAPTVETRGRKTSNRVAL